MLVLLIFGIIIALSVGLSLYNSNNHDIIKEFYENNQCQSVSYYHGKYLGVCDGNITMYQNSFVLDMENPTIQVPIDKIKNTEVISKKATANSNEKNNILITLSNGQQVMLEFENKQKLEDFKGSINK